MDDEWSLTEYQPPESEERWFFRKNLDPRTPQGRAAYPYLVYLTLHFVPRDASGLPSQEDQEVLYEMEDNQLPAIEEPGKAVHVASVIKAGIKDVLFYASDPDVFLEQAALVQSRYPQFAVACEICEDPGWEQYEDFP
ncbi:DUF695 domain-containing protein [Hydrogenophaga sp.]|uniref:DUF695 domain-containing protein n=1 Tax=Hydrogenophaga sp. TaxID=1904254 RepID=UPI002FC75898